MIKILIVVSGLVMFVPDAGPDPQGLTALLLETQFSPQGEMPRHFVVLRQRFEQGIFNWSVVNGNFKATFKVGAGGKPSINLSAAEHFPHLGQLIAKQEKATINSKCLDGTCADDGKHKRVAAIVRFEGAWQTRPLQRCAEQWLKPVDFREKTKSDFRKAADVAANVVRPLGGVTKRPLATALGLDAQVESLGDLHVYIGDVEQKLQLSSPAVCKDWLGDDHVNSCVVIELENWPKLELSVECRGNQPPKECRIDNHFAAFYDLVTKPPQPADRWVPYVAEGDVSCAKTSGPTQPPGIRCPPSFWP